MSRRFLSNILSGEELSLPDVWGWYEFQRALIGEETSRVLAAPLNAPDSSMSRYTGKTREEVQVDLAYQTSELRNMAMLGMLACTEAALRVDFIERVMNKRKDDVSREFGKAYVRQGIDKIRLEEDILDVWRVFGVNINLPVSEFKGALLLRHWLAHGRYWKPKLGRASGYDPVDVFDICFALLSAAELMPIGAAA